MNMPAVQPQAKMRRCNVGGVIIIYYHSGKLRESHMTWMPVMCTSTVATYN